MHYYNAILIILFSYVHFILSSSPILLPFPSPSSDLSPYYIFYNNRKFLFTSQGVYYIITNSSIYSLKSAYPEFSLDFTVDSYAGEYTYYQLNETHSLFVLPLVNNGIFCKTYSRKTSSNTFRELSYSILAETKPNVDLLNDGTIIISFIEQNQHKGFLLVLGNDKEIITQRITQNVITDTIFTCKYFPFTLVILCIFGTKSNVIRYYSYTNNGFNAIKELGSIESNLLSDGIKLLNLNNYRNIGSILEYNTKRVIFFSFDLDTQTIYYAYLRDYHETNMFIDDYNYYLFAVNSNTLFIGGSKDGVFHCRLFDNALDFRSLTMSSYDYCADEGYHVRISYYDNTLLFSFLNKNTNNVYIYEHIMSNCLNLNLNLSTNVGVFLSIEDLVNLSQSTNDAFIQLINENSETKLGKWYTIQKDTETKEEIIYQSPYSLDNKVIQYSPIYPQEETYDFIIHYQREERFYMSTGICTIKIKNKCYSSCNNCNEVGDEYDHKCTQCANGFHYKEFTQNCYTGNIDRAYYDSLLQIYKECSDENCKQCDTSSHCISCDEGYTFLSTYSDNENDSKCISICENIYYINEDYNLVCIEENRVCPSKYPCFNKNNNRCYSLNDHNDECIFLFPQSNNIETINDYIDNNIIQLYNNNFYYENWNYTVIVYDSSQQRDIEKLTIIYLEGCEKKIKEEYHIENEKPFIIGQVEYVDQNDVFYSFYLDDGRKINISICSNESVSISSKVNEEELTITPAKIELLYKQNIDVFNSNDSFFNDNCYEFSDDELKTKRDITIIDRRKKYYQNITLKRENCEYSSTEISTMRVSFKCSVKSNNNIMYFSGKKTSEFPSPLSNSTFSVVLCLDKIGKISLMAKNIGNYIMMSICILQTIIFLVYLCKRKNLYSYFLNREEEKELPENSKESLEEITNKSKKTEGSIFIYEKPKILNQIGMQNKTSDITVSRKNSDTTDIQRDVDNNDNYYDSLGFSESIIYDTRPFSSLVLKTLKKNSSLYLLFSNNHNTIKTVVASTSLFFISISFFFNALYYNSTYISHLYFEGYDFIFELPKYLLSSASTLGVKVIIDLIAMKSFPIMNSINKDIYKNAKTKRKYISRMKRCNCISLFIINITSFFSWLFISTFCCIYVNTQRFWLFGSLVSLVIDNIIALLLSILCTLLRLISFKCNNEFFYHMAKLIDNW